MNDMTVSTVFVDEPSLLANRDTPPAYGAITKTRVDADSRPVRSDATRRAVPRRMLDFGSAEGLDGASAGRLATDLDLRSPQAGLLGKADFPAAASFQPRGRVRRARGQVAQAQPQPQPRPRLVAGGWWLVAEAKQLGHLDPQIEVAQLAFEIHALGRAANADSVLHGGNEPTAWRPRVLSADCGQR
jgi:hypothetical protein